MFERRRENTLKPVFHLATIFFRASKQKANVIGWVVMSSVFVASQSSCLKLLMFAQTNSPSGKQALEGVNIDEF